MPNLRDIQEFASELKALGNEPEILRRRGEEEPDSQPVGGQGAGAPEEETSVPSDELDEGVPPDIDQLLAGLGEEPPYEEPGYGEPALDEPISDEPPLGEPGPEVEGPPPEAPAPEESAGEEPLSEQPSPGEAAPVEMPPGTEGSERGPEDQFIDEYLSQSDAAEETELTSIEEPDDSLFFDVPSPEDLQPPAGIPGRAAPAPPEVAAEGELEESTDVEEPPSSGETPTAGAAAQLGETEDLEELEALLEGSGDEASADVAPGDETPGEEPPAAGEFDLPEDFELPGDLELPGELDLGEEGGSVGEPDLSAEEGGPSPLGGEEGFEEPSFPEEEPLAEEPSGPDIELPREAEEFGLPSLDDELFGQEPGAGEGGEAGEAEPDFDDFSAAELFEEPQGGEGGPALESEAGGAPPGEPAPGELPSEEALFEEAGFEAPAVEGAGEGQAAGESAGGASSDQAALSAAGAEIDDLDLGDIGEEFGLGGGEGEPLSEEELNPALSIGEPEGEAPSGAAATSTEGEVPRGAGEPATVRLSNREFERVQQTLSSLPRNLRIVVEELIGEQEIGGRELDRLVRLLVRGAPPRDVADLAGRIVGRRIEIPASYAKRSGLAFEEERATFGYRFRHNILPILRVFVAASAVLAILAFLAYHFVYSPIRAYSLYAQGYHQLQQDNFITANQDFSRAAQRWQMKNWYFTYAKGFTNKKQYSFAAQKYESLLKVWPGDRKAIFDYASMESQMLGNYAKANQLLNIVLNKNQWDFQGLLRAGENYLAWGAQDASKYNLARRDFAMLLQHYGPNNQVLFQMLRYFIFTDNLKQVEILKNRFQSLPGIKVNPVAYAELGGYLIDKHRLSDVHSILFRALKADPKLPLTNYNLARYFKEIQNYSQEGVALQRTLDFLQNSTPLDRRRLGMLIKTYDLIGENLYRQKRYLDAQKAYTKGINRYEAALRQDQLKPAAAYGKLYANLGDISYYQGGNYNEALRLYLKAQSNDYKTPQLQYKEGYVYYRNKDYKNALMKFYNAAGTFSDNRNLMFATANTLYNRNDYFAAEGYYLNLLNMLEEKRQSITNFQPNTVPAQHDLLVDLMKVYNNLGVTLNQLSKRSSNSSKYSQALVNLTHSMDAYNRLTRNPVTKETPPSVNLAYINTKNILYPTPNYQLQLYADLAQNLQSHTF